MSFKVSISSPNLDRQIELLKYYHEIAEKHIRPAVVTSTQDLKKAIEPNIPVLSGNAKRMFKASVIGQGLSIKGTVGFGGGKSSPWYMNDVEFGSRRHPINPGVSTRSKRKRKIFEEGDALYGNMKGADKAGTHIRVNGAWKTKTVVNGFPGRRFMRDGFDNQKGEIKGNLAKAVNQIVNDLTVK